MSSRGSGRREDGEVVGVLEDGEVVRALEDVVA